MTDTERRNGYHIHDETVWAAAHHDYARGDSAASVCDAYDLNLSTFRDRARREGWRRSDMAAWAEAEHKEAAFAYEDVDTDPVAMAMAAWRHAAVAIAKGDRHGARTWTRLAAELRAVAAASLDEAEKECHQDIEDARDWSGHPDLDVDHIAGEGLMAAIAHTDPPETRIRNAAGRTVHIAFARRLIRPRVTVAEGFPAISHHSHHFSDGAPTAD